MPNPVLPTRDPGPIPRWPAALLLAHLALLITLKSSRGLEPELLWISHVAMAIAAVGFLLRSVALLAVAFVSIAALHAAWILDAAIGLTTGDFPLQMANYLPTSDAWTWIATSHHAYLAQLIAVFLIARRVNVIGTFCASFVLFLYLAAVSRLFLDPLFNVNRAHTIFLGWDSVFAHNANALPAIQYIPGLAATTAVLFFFPSAIMLWMLGRKNEKDPSTRKTPSRVVADIFHMHREPQSNPSPRRRAFTLIELVAVMVVLAVLSAVAIPKYFDYADRAKEAADVASIAAIETAMNDAYLQHRLEDAPNTEWITNINMIRTLMDTGELPSGIIFNPTNPAFLKDQRGYNYSLYAETATRPARFFRFNPGVGGS